MNVEELLKPANSKRIKIHINKTGKNVRLKKHELSTPCFECVKILMDIRDLARSVHYVPKFIKC